MNRSKAPNTPLPTAVLALFASSGTLICCALPITLVTLGMGATVASLTSAFPFLVALSEHKVWVFGFSAFSLALAGVALYRPGRSCPTDPRLAASCEGAQRWSRRIWWVSVVLFSIGFFAAFVALPLRIWLDL
jgi:hypothetical protein